MSVTSTSPYLQSTGDYKVSPFVRRVADITHRFDSLDSTIKGSQSYKNSGPISYRLKRFGAMLTQWDIGHFNTFFKGRVALPDNPMGMLLFILFPAVIGSRVLRAHQRDKSGVEVGDVLRRDIMTLIPFVFLAPALVNLINSQKQKRDGVNLTRKLDPRDIIPKAYSYSELGNAFDLNNAKKLEALVAEGNGRGLKKASENTLKMYENVLGTMPEGNEILNPYRRFVKTVSEMTAEAEVLKCTQDNPKTSALLKRLSESAYEDMSHAQKMFNDLGAPLLEGTQVAEGRRSLYKFSKNIRHLPSFSNALVQYAKMKRLPGDLLSITLTVVAMGYAPVAFNDYLSRKRLERMRNQQSANPFQQVAKA